VQLRGKKPAGSILKRPSGPVNARKCVCVCVCGEWRLEGRQRGQSAELQLGGAAIEGRPLQRELGARKSHICTFVRRALFGSYTQSVEMLRVVRRRLGAAR